MAGVGAGAGGSVGARGGDAGFANPATVEVVVIRSAVVVCLIVRAVGVGGGVR